MNISVIGTGYVGLVTGTCFAEMGYNVICVDIDETKIANLKNGIMPIYEPGLKEMVVRNYAEKRLSFTTDIQEASEKSNIHFIAVGTPPGADDAADLRFVLEVAKQLGQTMKQEYNVVIDKSTVPVGTADKVTDVIDNELAKRKDDVSFDVEQGMIKAVIGPNGAGKTTLFNLIAGNLPANSGTIYFEGDKINGRKPYQIAKSGLSNGTANHRRRSQRR